MHLLLNFLKKFSHILLLGIVFIMPLFLSIAQAKKQNTEVVSEVPLHVFLLIGGINMEGRGEITESDEKVVEDALIWDPQYSVWTQVRVPYGQYSPFLFEKKPGVCLLGEIELWTKLCTNIQDLQSGCSHWDYLCTTQPYDHSQLEAWSGSLAPSIF